MSDQLPNMEDILAQMRDSFLETAVEKIERLNEILQAFREKSPNASDLAEEFRREVHSLKGMGGTFQMGLVTKFCHQFETFLDEETGFDPIMVEKSQLYVDRLSDLLESPDAAHDHLLTKWIQDLPEKGNALEQLQDTGSKTLVLASQNPAILKTITQSFEGLDYQILSFNDPFEAFKQAVLCPARIIIVDQHFKEMDGADLIRSMEAQKKLSTVKIAMICPSRHEALSENLVGVTLLSEKNIDVDILNFIAIALTP